MSKAETPDNDERDERLAVFSSVRDFFRYAVSRFNAAGLAYGHGTTNAVDEAAFIVLEGLNLPIDSLEPFLDAALTRDERARLLQPDRRARLDAQARRLSAQSRLYPGRAVLCRRARRSCRAASSANCCSAASSARDR